MEGVRVLGGRSQCIGFQKYSLACFQIFESKALDICSEVQQLAEMTMGMTVECTNKRCVLQLLGMVSRTKHVWYSEHGMYC